MNNINKSITIAIAGTVGVGKSTLTKTLAEKLNFKTSFENVEQNPYLDKYYKNFKKWGFHLQIFFLAERLKAHKKIFEYGGGFVIDRTIYEDVEIFAKMNYENGSMSTDDYQTYCSLFNAMVYSPYFRPPDLVIYLEGEIDDIITRINQRGRVSELETDINYWHNLNNHYQDWIDNFRETKILRLNISDYDINNDASVNHIITKINTMLKS